MSAVLQLWSHGSGNEKEDLGQIKLAPKATNEMVKAHWKQALLTPGFETAMWHTLTLSE